MRLIKTLFIDSEYRDEHETNSRFKVHLDNPIYCNGFLSNIYHIQIHYIHFKIQEKHFIYIYLVMVL
jgi:hypothetical protein